MGLCAAGKEGDEAVAFGDYGLNADVRRPPSPDRRPRIKYPERSLTRPHRPFGIRTSRQFSPRQSTESGLVPCRLPAYWTAGKTRTKHDAVYGHDHNMNEKTQNAQFPGGNIYGVDDEPF